MAKKKRNGFNRVIVLSVVVILIFAFLLTRPDMQEILHPHTQSQMRLVTETALTPTIEPTVTPLPEDYPDLPREFFGNDKETDMPALGGTIVFLIILVGVYISKRQYDK